MIYKMQTTKQAQVKGAIHHDNPILFHAKNKKNISPLYHENDKVNILF